MLTSDVLILQVVVKALFFLQGKEGGSQATEAKEQIRGDRHLELGMRRPESGVVCFVVGRRAGRVWNKKEM